MAVLALLSVDASANISPLGANLTSRIQWRESRPSNNTYTNKQDIRSITHSHRRRSIMQQQQWALPREVGTGYKSGSG